ncbi:MAG: catechol 2,3-dioxygenase-like lactoylglutathione lyase family enzyme [Gammaproteobacteria bacterium]
MEIAQHSLFVEDLKSSIDFYRDKLGMTVVRSPSGTINEKSIQRYHLSFEDAGSLTDGPSASEAPREALLELVARPGFRKSATTSTKPGYWKIGITL